MRIIAGELRRRRLAAPDFEGLRPTSDRLRETLFNVLAPRVPGAVILDAFAGTGALGIEALSRGASHVTFVDEDRRAIALIEENVRRCAVAARCAIIRGRFNDVTQRLSRAPFDLVLLDPPYETEHDVVRDALEAAARTLAEEGVIVLEHARRRDAPAVEGHLVRTRTIVSGDSGLSLYRRPSGEGHG